MHLNYKTNAVKVSDHIKQVLDKQNSFQNKLKQVYMWIKQDFISFGQFQGILDYLYETNTEEKHPTLKRWKEMFDELEEKS